MYCHVFYETQCTVEFEQYNFTVVLFLFRVTVDCFLMIAEYC